MKCIKCNKEIDSSNNCCSECGLYYTDDTNLDVDNIIKEDEDINENKYLNMPIYLRIFILFICFFCITFILMFFLYTFYRYIIKKNDSFVIFSFIILFLGKYIIEYVINLYIYMYKKIFPDSKMIYLAIFEVFILLFVLLCFSFIIGLF